MQSRAHSKFELNSIFSPPESSENGPASTPENWTEAEGATHPNEMVAGWKFIAIQQAQGDIPPTVAQPPETSEPMEIIPGEHSEQQVQVGLLFIPYVADGSGQTWGNITAGVKSNSNFKKDTRF